MFLSFHGLLLIISIASYTQTDEKLIKYKLKTKPNLNSDNNNEFNKDNNSKTRKWDFEDYMKKFKPSTIWERIDKQRKYKGEVITDAEQSEIMFQAMDPFEEIMQLQVDHGDTKVLLQQDGRRGWRPPKAQHWLKSDTFHLRRRLYELMKQAIYQARNKMTIMQIYREKYSNSSLYKMGFLFNRADNAAKTYAKFSFRAYRGCLLVREYKYERMSLYDILSANERQLNLWFDVELIVDLIMKNEEICREIFKNQTVDRKKTFDAKFYN